MTAGRRLRSTTLSVAVLVLFPGASGLVAQPAPLSAGDQLTAEAWQEDIRYFHRMLPETHTEPFHSMSRAQFDDNMLKEPVITGIVEREALDTKGRFYVLISRYTFSAAGHLVTYLERFTNAIFVGEPTGASPNHCGDAPPSTCRTAASA